jgi:hypothetical protein
MDTILLAGKCLRTPSLSNWSIIYWDYQITTLILILTERLLNP